MTATARSPSISLRWRSKGGDGIRLVPAFRSFVRHRGNLLYGLRKAKGTSGPMPTFASLLGRHLCECWHQRTTSKIIVASGALDLTFAMQGLAAGGQRASNPLHWCPDSEARAVLRHSRLRTSESKNASKLLIECGFGSERPPHELAATMMRTSEPPQQQIYDSTAAFDLKFLYKSCRA
jgi:hypothetical protein